MKDNINVDIDQLVGLLISSNEDDVSMGIEIVNNFYDKIERDNLREKLLKTGWLKSTDEVRAMKLLGKDIIYI